MSCEPGQNLLHYHLIEKIGEGGMGVVWRARDDRLKREVALKLLLPDIIEDSHRRQRFLHEARAAAAISHPHIATVLEIGEADGRSFIAMELVKGESLRVHINRGPLPVADVLAIACEAADGLTYAHRAGVIHRDLKPENIMVGADGHTRLLDFGLAKLIEAEGPAIPAASQVPTISNLSTLQGKVFGTAAYMSPEQARGGTIDYRSDIFSLGAIIYEMLTGQSPFRGASALDILTAVIREEPRPLSVLNPDTPPELERIVRKCLQKQPGERYQDTGDLFVDLRQLRRLTESQLISRSALPRSPSSSARRRGVGLAVGALLLALAAFVALRYLAPGAQKERSPAGIAEKMLTTNTPENPVITAVISPGGRYLAYTESPGLSVKVLETGEIKTLTPIAGTENVQVVGWFPDETRLALLLAADGSPTALWSLSIVTGALQKIRDKVVGPWLNVVSPDGRTIAYIPYTEGQDEIWLMDADGTQPRRIAVAGKDETVAWWVTWSPDSRRIAYRRQARYAEGYKNSIETCDLQGGERTVVLEPTLHYFPGIHAVWARDGRILFTRTETTDRLRSSGLWAVDLDPGTGRPKGAPRRLTTWVGYFVYFLSTTTSGEVAAVRWRTQAEILMTSPDPALKRMRALRPVTNDALDDWMGAWLPDGKSVFFSSNRRGTMDIFRLDIGSGAATPVVTGPQEDRFLALSPDRQWLLYDLRAAPRVVATTVESKIMRAAVAGGPPVEIQAMGFREGVRCGSRSDARCVIGQPSEDGSMEFFEFDLLQGKGSLLGRADESATAAAWALSPDGRMVAWQVNHEEGPTTVHFLDLETGRQRQVALDVDDDIGAVNWSSAGDELLAATDPNASILRIRLDGSTERWPYEDGRKYPYGSSLWESPDGQTILVGAGLRESSVWLLDDY